MNIVMKTDSGSLLTLIVVLALLVLLRGKGAEFGAQACQGRGLPAACGPHKGQADLCNTHGPK